MKITNFKKFMSVMLVVALVITGISVTPNSVKAEETTKYKVTWDANGGIFTETDGDTIITGCTYGQTIKFSPFTPEREGYTFAGWFTLSVGGDEVKSSDTYNIEGMSTYFAHWTANTYTVKFDTDGGSEVTDVVAIYDREFELPTPVKTGYTFTGWYTDEACETPVTVTSEGKAKNLTSTADGKVTLYAGWSVNYYTIAFNPNNKTSSYSNRFKYGTKITLDDANKTGYDFEGWVDTETDTKVDTNYTVTKNATLSATYAAKTYEIKWNFETATGSSVITTNQVFDEKYSDVPENPTRPHYEFAGWYTSEEGGDKVDVNGTFTTAGNVDYYTHWSTIAYTVKFDANGGEGSIEPQVIDNSEKVTLNENTFTRDNYIFRGWNTLKDATDVLYKDGIEVENLTEIGKEITLYAIWEEVLGTKITGLNNKGILIDSNNNTYDLYSVLNNDGKNYIKAGESKIYADDISNYNVYESDGNLYLVDSDNVTYLIGNKEEVEAESEAKRYEEKNPTKPTTEPTTEPTTKPSVTSSPSVTDTPNVEPTTDVATVEPTEDVATVEPTTEVPTVEPTTEVPTVEPTTDVATVEPTTDAPTTTTLPTDTTAPVNTTAPTNTTAPANTTTPANQTTPANAATTQVVTKIVTVAAVQPTTTPTTLDKVVIKSAKNNAKKTVLVKWAKVDGAEGYQVQYSLKKNFKGKKSKTTTKAKLKIKKLKKNKKYFIRVRAFKTVDGKKVYGAWSAGKKVKIKK
ncbi:MAG: InlB B-repeat-containing protein [Lachnospiraceae bacterium]|nr:InlB B-repeat-containing protein [Lachnospiraceae bacterium]